MHNQQPAFHDLVGGTGAATRLRKKYTKLQKRQAGEGEKWGRVRLGGNGLSIGMMWDPGQGQSPPDHCTIKTVNRSSGSREGFAGEARVLFRQKTGSAPNLQRVFYVSAFIMVRCASFVARMSIAMDLHSTLQVVTWDSIRVYLSHTMMQDDIE